MYRIYRACRTPHETLPHNPRLMRWAGLTLLDPTFLSSACQFHTVAPLSTFRLPAARARRAATCVNTPRGLAPHQRYGESVSCVISNVNFGLSLSTLTYSSKALLLYNRERTRSGRWSRAALRPTPSASQYGESVRGAVTVGEKKKPPSGGAARRRAGGGAGGSTHAVDASAVLYRMSSSRKKIAGNATAIGCLPEFRAREGKTAATEFIVERDINTGTHFYVSRQGLDLNAPHGSGSIVNNTNQTTGSVHSKSRLGRYRIDDDGGKPSDAGGLASRPTKRLRDGPVKGLYSKKSLQKCGQHVGAGAEVRRGRRAAGGGALHCCYQPLSPLTGFSRAYIPPGAGRAGAARGRDFHARGGWFKAFRELGTTGERQGKFYWVRAAFAAEKFAGFIKKVMHTIIQSRTPRPAIESSTHRVNIRVPYVFQVVGADVVERLHNGGGRRSGPLHNPDLSGRDHSTKTSGGNGRTEKKKQQKEPLQHKHHDNFTVFHLRCAHDRVRSTNGRGREPSLLAPLAAAPGATRRASTPRAEGWGVPRREVEA
ncbi:hypothetical protein EVAR_34754_1 [Eumeta japonica]|uniref:Uncharacterized protein n=1 Tax=Eumeta variegata TaxID=151549 RepID=A0A4C1YLX1_EUMVA|nr:hypothetical protein EVAR_34754_1 [Eumeta japonica]